MTISFPCTGCGRTLRTPDDKAGLEAPCPSCGTLVTVPSPSTDDEDHAEFDRDIEATVGGQASTAAGATSVDPFTAMFESRGKGTSRVEAVRMVPEPPVESESPCPVCGTLNDSTALKCRSCGEALGLPCPSCHAPNPAQAGRCHACGSLLGFRGSRPDSLNPGEALSAAWKLFGDNLGVCIGSSLLFMVLTLVQNVFTQLGLPIVLAAIEPPGGGPPDHAQVAILLSAGVVVWFVLLALGIYLQAGMNHLFYRLALHGEADLSQMFLVPRFGKIFIASVVLWFAIAITLSISIVPAFVLGFSVRASLDRPEVFFPVAFLGLIPFFGVLLVCSRFWYYIFVILDDPQVGPLQAIGRSWTIVSGNMVNLIGTLILFFLVTMAGVCVCYMGLIATIPLAMLMNAIGYLQLTGARVRTE